MRLSLSLSLHTLLSVPEDIQGRKNRNRIRSKRPLVSKTILAIERLVIGRRNCNTGLDNRCVVPYSEGTRPDASFPIVAPACSSKRNYSLIVNE
mmetsp:Transcript_17820/g.36630  ORF Transcript_17820/g.36630 Transcript_17820/m.36630 type:complete len:94 (+) Transcript_17820:245-526(+)